jgi:hypothetical protein
MNTKSNKLNFTRAAIYFTLAAGLLVGLFHLKLASLSAQTREQEAGQGMQQRGGVKKITPPAGSHLHVVLRLTEDGTAEVLTATELPGEAVVSDVPAGDFVYEVASDQQTLAVEAVPDPFELRSFPDPEATSFQGHHRARAKTATLIVKVPKASLASTDLDQLAMRFYKLKPDVQLEQINPAELRKLKESDQLEMQLAVPDHQLGPELRQKGRKVGLQ